jgi:hypothetical protein
MTAATMAASTMGDLRGRRARWTAAAVLAPVAAAVFAGTTAWASSHDPNATAAPTAAPKANHTVDPVLRKLRLDVEKQTKEVTRMRANLKGLHKKTQALAQPSTSGGSTGSGYTSYSSGGSSYSGGTSSGSSGYSSGGSSAGSSGSSGGSSGSSGGGTTTTPVAPAPTPHTSTGASTPAP